MLSKQLRWFFATSRKWSKGEGEGEMDSQTSISPSPDYSWLELVPVLILLFLVAGFIAFLPTFDFVQPTRPDVNLDNVFNNSTLEEP